MIAYRVYSDAESLAGAGMRQQSSARQFSMVGTHWRVLWSGTWKSRGYRSMVRVFQQYELEWGMIRFQMKV